MDSEGITSPGTVDINGFVEYEPLSTRWYYLGEDKREHGPYTNSDMMRWVDSGYFGNDLMIRTERDDSYNSLYSYIQLCNGLPFHNSFADGQNRSTPLPVRYPMMVLQQPPGMVPTSQFHSTITPNMYVNSNGYSVPSGGTVYLSSQPGLNGYGMKTQGYGIERENPSSSSVSDSPDFDRCSHGDEIGTDDKCVGTEDAPWMKSNKVDMGTDAPMYSLNMTTSYSQTPAITIKSSQVSRLLKELTGVNFYVR